jgi:hypothetical protein
MAGSVPTIKTRLEADVDGFIANVKKAGQAGERAMGQVKAAGGALADGGRLANGQMQRIALHSLEAERAAVRFREAIHISHPILEAAGLGVGNLGAFAALARGGLIGLGVAGAGAAVVGLARIGDQAKLTRQQLTAALGPEAIERLEKGARLLGTSVENVGNPAAIIEDTRRLSGGAKWITTGRPIKTVSPSGEHIFPVAGQAVDESATFQQLIRSSGGATPDDATKAETAFFETFRKQVVAHPGAEPILTTEALEALPRGAGNELTRLLGHGSDVTQLIRDLAGGARVPFSQITGILDQQRSQIERQFQARAPEQRLVAETGEGAYQAVRGSVLEPVGQKVSTAANTVLSNVPKAIDAMKDIKLNVAPEGYVAKLQQNFQEDVVPFKAALSAAAQAAIDFAVRLGRGSGPASEAPGTATGGTWAKLPQLQAPPHAQGGVIRGPGTGTSDSILARVSNNEFIVTAKAHAAVGTAFLDAVNAGNVRAFADGGLIADLSMPSIRQSSFSSSSFSDRSSEAPSSMQPAHIHFGTRTVGPVYGSPDVIGALHREATDYLDAQGGRQPSWQR